MNKQTSITCPECGSYQNRVTDTRHGNLTNHSSHAHLIQLGLKEYTRRRRRCSECGHAWSTVEVPAGELEGAADEIRRLRLVIKKQRWEAGIRTFEGVAEAMGDQWGGRDLPAAIEQLQLI